MTTNYPIKNVIYTGISVSAGIGFGNIIIYRTDFDDVTEYTIEKDKINGEIKRYNDAVNEVDLIFSNNKKRVEIEENSDDARIYETYQLILNDPFFKEEVPAAIKSQHKNAEFTLCTKLNFYEKHFETIEDDYLRERIFDIRGVSRRLIYHLLQYESDEQLSQPTNDGNIIIARELTPADSIHFHHKSLKGLITEFGGKTSHAAILARSLEVPAIVGIKDLVKKTVSGSPAIVDGVEGELIINPDKETIEKYKQKLIEYNDQKQLLIEKLNHPTQKSLNKKIRLLVNINEQSEIEIAHKYKAEGVGLYRTELHFIAKERLLREQEQFLTYRQILTNFQDKEVAIRMLDLGGDKFLDFHHKYKESNPFLGWRSIRILLSETDVFKTQIRAVLRASAFGKAKIMLPMISSREEIVASRNLISEVKKELDKEKIRYDKNIPLGIMVEIPSAAVTMEDLVQHVDFVSIGTNDLIQYTLAVDRNNEKVASYYQPLNPAIISLIKNVITVCNKFHKPVSICGEMAGDPEYTQLLLALGVIDFSMQPVSIPTINNIICCTTEKTLQLIKSKLNGFYTASELSSFLKNCLKETRI